MLRSNQNLGHLKALSQCEDTLTRLGLVKEAVDDTAGAAKVHLDLIVDQVVCSPPFFFTGSDGT